MTESVLAVRQEPVLRELVRWRGADTMESARRTRRELLARQLAPAEDTCNRFATERETPVVVDEIGLGGGVVDKLNELGVPVTAFNSARKARDDRFLNARAEAYWTLRKLLEAGAIALPPDEMLFEELLATRWAVTATGKIQLEAKDDIRRKLGRSPDRADAVVMAFAETGRCRTGGALVAL